MRWFIYKAFGVLLMVSPIIAVALAIGIDFGWLMVLKGAGIVCAVLVIVLAVMLGASILTDTKKP